MNELSKDEMGGSALADVPEVVPKDRERAFLRFVETGEADDDFLDYLNKDEGCKRAVERAFTQQAQGFQELAAALKEPPVEIENIKASVLSEPNRISKQIAAIFEVALKAAAADRDQVVEKSTARIAAATPLEDLGIVTKVVKSLENNLAKVNRA